MSKNTEPKKAGIAIGLGMEYRLGPTRTMNINTYVSQDDSLDSINIEADKMVAVVSRQQALHEIEGWQDTVDIKMEELEQETLLLEKYHEGYELDKIRIKQEWDKKHDELVKSSEESWRLKGRKGDYKLQPQHESALKNLDNSNQKKMDELKLGYEANVRNSKANIHQIELIIRKAKDSIKKRQDFISDKKKLKLFNEG